MPDNGRIAVKKRGSKPVRLNARKTSHVVILISTFSNEESAVKVAQHVIGLGYCACASLARVRSIYKWKGKLNDEQEITVLFKTSDRVAGLLKETIAKIHPYDVPEILELDTLSSSISYLNWINDSTKGITQQGNNSTKR
jgi:periplasmic divalent cation tolerance protein